MSADVVHIYDEHTGIPHALYCRATFYTSRPRAVGSHRVHEATCPDCIEAYETRPLPVTTADLLPIVQALRSVAHVAAAPPRPGTLNYMLGLLDELAQKLARPRKAKQQP